MNTTHTRIFGVSKKAIRCIAMITLVALVALTTLSCTQHEEDKPIPPIPPTDATDVLFELNIPQSTAPTTYALTKENEDQIKTIEILLFKEDPNDGIKKYTGKPYFCDKIESGTGVNSHLKHFLVSLPVGGPYDIVVLANSRKTVNDLPAASTPAGTKKEDVLKLLTINHNTKWISDIASSSYVPFPMWDELKGKSISENLKFNILMTRMLAKIDVALATPAAIAALYLEDVYLVNANKDGHIVPGEGKMSAGRPTAPTLVEGSAINTTPLKYLASEASKPGKEFKNVIYTFEAKQAATGALDQATCIVIKGIYTTDGKEYFYRLDIGDKESDGTIKYLDILRNMRYSINISKIGGPGYGKLQEAIDGPSSNIEAKVVVWDSNELPIVVFDDNHTLGFSRDTVVVGYAASQANQIKIRTDHPDGWKLKRIIDTNGVPITTWLTIPTASGAADVTANVQFKFLQNDGSLRTCYAEFGAGLLTHFVVVKQLSLQRINRVVWQDYVGGDFNSITIEDDQGNVYTSAVNSSGQLVVGTVLTPLEIAGVITKIKPIYKSYVLDVPAMNYSLDSSTGVITINDISLIGIPLHLDKIRNYPSGSYIQVSDVELSGYTNLSSELDNWRPIGTLAIPFTGSYDGGAGAAGDGSGFNILTLKINRPTSSYIGLFGSIASATLNNIHIASSGNISGGGTVGSICGYNGTGSVIKDCSNAAPITGADMYVGGICGQLNRGNIENCVNEIGGSVLGNSNYVGGICGENIFNIDAGIISGCENKAKVTGAGVYVGGIAGYSNGKIMGGCINSGVFIEGDKDCIGGICGMNAGTISDCTNTIGTTIMGFSVGAIAADNIGGICGINTPSGVVERCTNEGEVSAIDSNKYIGGICGMNSGIIRDECLNTGTIYGNDGTYVGGIAGSNYAVSKNTTITDCVNEGNVSCNRSWVGGIAGDNQSNDSYIQSITHCTNRGSIDGKGGYVGGISGRNYARGVITDCTNDVTGIVTGKDYVGGISGWGINDPAPLERCTNTASVTGVQNVGGIYGTNPSGEVNKCTNTGNITGTGNVGGISGSILDDAIIDNCANTGRISRTGTEDTGGSAGGICGYNGGGTIRNLCTNTGEITGSTDYDGDLESVGGICGHVFEGVIDKCSNSGVIRMSTGAPNSVGGTGGICGYNEGASITECHNLAGNVEGSSYVGGVCGKNAASSTGVVAIIDRCTNAANISGKKTANNLGGISGHNDGGEISGSRNDGMVSGDNNLGGISGYNNGANALISDCTNTADISGVIRIGGICGYNNNGQIGGTVAQACLNSGPITGKGNNTGGICGLNGGNPGNLADISNCSNTGTITGEAGGVNLGGISGQSFGAISNCANSGPVNGATDNVGGICGNNDGGATIEFSTNSAPIQGLANGIGGISGRNYEGQINGCQNNATVKGSGNIGGICGINTTSATLSYCINEGAIDGVDNVGGISGRNQNSATISKCTNTANVVGALDDVGGICGLNDGTGTPTVINCINKGAVNGPSRVGGICGTNSASVGITSACYNIGAVTANTPVGPVVGAGSLALHCYYGGAAASMTATLGAIAFGSAVGDWPTIAMTGWTLTTTGGAWTSLGGWNVGGTTVYPTLSPSTR